MRKELSKYLLDISKLTFWGIVLTVILEIEANKLVILGLGLIASFILALIAFLLVMIGNRK
jgi:hypothetical protein